MKQIALAAALLLAAGIAGAGDHLVTGDAAEARLSEAAAARSGDRATLSGILTAPGADQAATRLGFEIQDVRAGLASLSDAEVRDLAQRTRTLSTDPASGMSKDVDRLLVIFLIVAIVILVLSAVD